MSRGLAGLLRLLWLACCAWPAVAGWPLMPGLADARTKISFFSFFISFPAGPQAGAGYHRTRAQPGQDSVACGRARRQLGALHAHLKFLSSVPSAAVLHACCTMYVQCRPSSPLGWRASQHAEKGGDTGASAGLDGWREYEACGGYRRKACRVGRLGAKQVSGMQASVSNVQRSQNVQQRCNAAATARARAQLQWGEPAMNVPLRRPRSRADSQCSMRGLQNGVHWPSKGGTGLGKRGSWQPTVKQHKSWGPRGAAAPWRGAGGCTGGAGRHTGLIHRPGTKEGA